MPGTKFKQVKDKDPNTESYLAKVSKVESGDNPNARNPNGSATGLFQFTEGTWDGLNKKYKLGYTLDDRKNPEKAANVMRLFTQENEAALKPVLGRDLNDGERYLAHFLGSGGARKFFSVYKANPNAPISTVLSAEAIKANKGVVYNKDGSLKTVDDIYGWANGKMDMKVKPKVFTSTSQVETTAYDAPNFTSSSVPLETSTTAYVEPEPEADTKEVQQAKQEINEKSFVQDLSNIFAQQAQQPIPEISQEPEVDMSGAYNYINIDEY